jgi:hypothetical protein
MRWSILIRFVAYPLGAYGVVCLLIFLMQRSMMYFPTRLTETSALAQAKGLNLEPWRDASGVLLGWKSPHPLGKAQGRLLVLHGNAGMALDRGYLARIFQQSSLPQRWDVFLLEYPGYGTRLGRPSEADFVNASVQALDQLKTEDASPVYLLGESIGSGSACLALAKRPDFVQGLFLITPLNHMKAVARFHYPWFPSFLLRDRFQADHALKAYRGPLAVLLAERDEVIPAPLGRTLFDGYAGPKRLWLDEGATHNTLDFDPRRPMWQDIAMFLEAR